MTLSELMADPVWAAKTNAAVCEDLHASETVPAASVHVPASSIAALLPIVAVTKWRTHANADAVSAWEVFRTLLSAGGTVRGDRVVEQATALLALAVITQATHDAVVLLTAQTRTVAQGLGVSGPISEFLVSEAREG